MYKRQALNRGEHIITKKGLDWVDVTDNPQPSNGADAEYRIVFKKAAMAVDTHVFRVSHPCHWSIVYTTYIPYI